MGNPMNRVTCFDDLEWPWKSEPEGPMQFFGLNLHMYAILFDLERPISA